MPDVGGEYALYMMDLGAPNGFRNRPFARLSWLANLDALPLSPYTSAGPWMDVILDPPRGFP